MTIVTAGTPPSRIAFEVSATGESSTNTVQGAKWVCRARWIGRELLIHSDVNHAGRSMHLCDYWSTSDDGQRLTMEHRGDDLAGQITVFDRIGGAA